MRFDICIAIETCLDLCQPRAVAANVVTDFEPSESRIIEPDRQAVKSILLNVIGNGIKVTGDPT